MTKTEKTNPNVLQQQLTFRQTTPYFFEERNTITIQGMTSGKRYSYTYPYRYGSNEIVNNNIDNDYIFEVPLIVEISGVFNNVQIELYNYTLDESGQEVIATTSYNRVSLPDLDLLQTQTLVINSAQSKILLYTYEDNTKTNLVSVIDVSPQVDPQYDSFLYARKGLSKIIINDEDVGNGFGLIGTWRRYTL